MSKMTYLWLSGVFFQALSTQKTWPRTPLGELTTLPQTPYSRLGGGYSLPIPFLLDAVSISEPRLSGPQRKFLATPMAYSIFSGLQLACPLKKPGAAPVCVAQKLK